jgi:hypothetical protein
LCWGFLSGEFLIGFFFVMLGIDADLCRIAFMVSFGFSLAGAVRDARSGYRVVESGDPESGMIENKRIGSGKGRDFE